MPPGLDLSFDNIVWMVAVDSDGKQLNKDLKLLEFLKPGWVVVREITMRGSTGSTWSAFMWK